MSAPQKAEMVLAASQGQRELCRGQGAEISWARQPQPLSTLQVIDILRRKTAPAFEVALRLGSIYVSPETCEELDSTLHDYSEALSIAYQIRDDLADLETEEAAKDIIGLRPSILLAIAAERANGESKTTLESVWKRASGASAEKIQSLYVDLKADERARTLQETYKEEAIRSLRDMENPSLKGLLRRVVGKIFNDAEIKGWCKEFEKKNGIRQTSVVALEQIGPYPGKNLITRRLLFCAELRHAPNR